MKKKVVIVSTILVLVIALAVPMLVSAAASTTDTARGPAALLDYCKGLIQQLVTDKKLSQSDADSVMASLESKQAELQANHRGAMGHIGRLGGLSLSELATTLGLSETDLQAKLQAGTTLWKVAADAGKLDALKTALIKQVTLQLDAMVQAGRLTADESKTRLADWTARINAITADSTGRDLPFFGKGGRGGRGMHGADVDDDGDSNTGPAQYRQTDTDSQVTPENNQTSDGTTSAA